MKFDLWDKKYYGQVVRDYENQRKSGGKTRYRSWEFCYEKFYETHLKYQNGLNPDNCKQKEEIIDYLALNLSNYLGSWGMYRNSFIQDYDYTIFVSVVEEILKPDYKDLWEPNFSAKLSKSTKPIDENNDLYKSIEKLFGAVNKILKKNSGKNITETLKTKIILGTIGCFPALDTYVNKTRDDDLFDECINKPIIISMLNFAIDHKNEINSLKIFDKNFDYPLMKMYDIYLFEFGSSVEFFYDFNNYKIGKKILGNPVIIKKRAKSFKKSHSNSLEFAIPTSLNSTEIEIDKYISLKLNKSKN